MSKESAYYEVIEDQRRMEQARAEAWREARSLEVRARSLTDQVDEARQKYGSEAAEMSRGLPRRPAESSGLAEIETYVAALRAHCTHVEGDLSRAIAIGETRGLLAEIAKRTAGKVIPSDELFSVPRPHAERATAQRTSTSTESERKQRDSDVARILSRLSGHVAPAERKELERFAVGIVQEPDAGRAETLALELRLRVQRLNEKAEKVARDAERAAVLRAGLRGLTGEDVASVIAELTRVERRELPLTDGLVQRVEDVGRVARARADRGYAADVIREELERLGYEVEEGFASLVVEGGQAQLRNPGSQDYRVLMDVEPGRNRMHVCLARFGRRGDFVSHEQTLRDQATEEKWCRDFALLRQALGRRHIASGVLRRVPAKAQPIQTIERPSLEARPRRRKTPLIERRT